MKLKQSFFAKRRSGMALVMVVLMLALMLVFMLAVYTMSDAELKGANRYAAGQQVRQFGDLAVDVAIAQVRKGTTPDAGTQGREVWTSQPGLIRQYQATGELLAGYKLYSSAQMVVPAGADAEKKLVNDLPPANWQELKARYVDLNRPIHRVANDGSTTLQFPIIDPRAMTEDTDTVSGFSYSATLSNGSKLAGVQTTGGDSQRLPMPVEWLYVLSDGTLGALNADNQFVGAVAPTAENPIVGRIAFWADDESSKVNINTASEPTPWAVPTFYHEEDASHARYQPVNGELQRYPGHPATTALSPILFPNKTITIAEKNLIYGLTPKIGTGGTNGGTVADTDASIAQIKLAQFRKERLYASLDEYLLREDRTENDFGIDVDAHDVVQRKGFFLTAHSRAPELNLHGLPKIALWPVSYRGKDYGTSFDQLIAFCSTLRQQGGGGLRQYVFQRGSADSTTADIQRAENQALLSYLNNLLQNPLPGFAAVPSQNYQAKYGDDLPQILTEIFDYVRSTNLHDGNIVQDAKVTTPGVDASQNFLLGYAASSSRPFQFKTFTDPRFFSADPDNDDANSAGLVEALGFPGHGQVTPSQWVVNGRTYQGIGRFPTVTEVGLHFICAADNTDDPDNPYTEQYATMGKPGGRSAPTIDGATPQARWYSNFPPLPKPNPFRGEKASTKLWPKTAGFPYGADPAHPGYQSVNWNMQLPLNTPLQPGHKLVQSRLLLEFFVPAEGYTLIEPEFTVRVSGLSKFTVNGQPLFPHDSEVIYTGRRATHVGNQMTGGYGLGLKGILRGREAPARTPMPADKNWGDDDWEVKPAATPGNDKCVLNYDLLSNFVDIDVGLNGLTPMNISQADLVIEIWSGHIGRVPTTGDTAAALVQTLKPTFPANIIASPTLVRQSNTAAATAHITEAPAWWTFYSRGALGFTLTKAQENNLPLLQTGKVSAVNERGRIFRDNVAPRTGSQPTRGAYFFGFDAEDSATRLFKPQVSASVAQAEIDEGSDVVQTVTIRHGDYRLTSAMNVVEADQWAPHRYYGQRRLAHSFTNFVSNQMPGYDYGTKAEFPNRLVATAAGGTYPASRIPDLPYFNEATLAAQLYGDFDNGPGPARDGPYINKPDEGNLNVVANGVPYLNESGQHTTADAVFFTPNRMIPSPGVLGSLPSGVKSGKPWRTLLFRPQVNHPGGPEKLGGANPPDHLLMEYFWMPVVEPYAISEPFSTAGKINLNYQIVPFTNIRRSSGLHALFAGERITAIPTADAPNYKVLPNAGDPADFWSTDEGKRWHYKIDAEKTLAQFDARFAAGKVFLSPSEICDLHLVPDRDVDSHEKMEAFWNDRRLTGDNTRERPYANLYPRLTTRSNTYRVHYTAQVIRKARSSPPDTITAADKFDSEYRGSSVIERYLDPAQADLPDFTTATTASAESLDNYYQFRVLEKRKFGN
jgi:uncharacterized protein (TIGR02600 family)